MDEISFAATIFSLAISAIAILLSVYFYTKNKETENNLTRIISDIENQTRTLERLNSTQTQRLLNTVSDIAQRRVHSEQSTHAEHFHLLNQLISSMRQSTSTDQSVSASDTNVITGHNLPNMSDPLDVKNLRFEAIAVVSTVYLYAGAANQYAQYLVPPARNRNEEEQFQKELYNFLDGACRDFLNARQFLLDCEQRFGQEMKKVPIFQHVVEQDKFMQQQVRDSVQTKLFWDDLDRKKA